MGTGVSTGTSLATNGVGPAEADIGVYDRRGHPIVMGLGELVELADYVVASGINSNINTREVAVTMMMLAQAEGLHPIEAVRRFNLIKGKPSKSAVAQHAEFLAKGGTFRWGRNDAEVCEATLSHPRTCPEPITIRLTMKDAKDRGIATEWSRDLGKFVVKDNFLKWPAGMLRARVITEGVRAAYPGIVIGIYSEEEIDDMQAGRGAVYVDAAIVPAPAAAATSPPPLGGRPRPGPAAIGHDAEKPATQRGGESDTASDREFREEVATMMVRRARMDEIPRPKSVPDPRAGIPDPADPAARFDPADFPEPPDVPGEVGRRQVDQFHWLAAVNRDMTDPEILASVRKRDPARKASHIEELSPVAAADLIRALADRAWKRNYWHESAIGDTVREDFPGLIPEAVEYATKGDAGEVLAAVMDTLGGGTGGAEATGEDAPAEPESTPAVAVADAGPAPVPYVMPEMVREEPRGRKPRKPKAEAEPEPATSVESQV